MILLSAFLSEPVYTPVLPVRAEVCQRQWGVIASMSSLTEAQENQETQEKSQPLTNNNSSDTMALSDKPSDNGESQHLRTQANEISSEVRSSCIATGKQVVGPINKYAISLLSLSPFTNFPFRLQSCNDDWTYFNWKCRLALVLARVDGWLPEIQLGGLVVNWKCKLRASHHIFTFELLACLGTHGNSNFWRQKIRRWRESGVECSRRSYDASLSLSLSLRLTVV